jgi:hypothetical protein
VNLLLEADRGAVAAETSAGETPIYFACIRGKRTVAQLLLREAPTERNICTVLQWSNEMDLIQVSCNEGTFKLS